MGPAVRRLSAEAIIAQPDWAGLMLSVLSLLPLCLAPAQHDLVIAGTAGSGNFTSCFLWILDLHPFMTVSTDYLSASLGGTVDFDLGLPLTEASSPYQIFASLSRVGPTKVAGVEIPLTLDPFQLSMAQNPPAFFTGLTGNLDTQGMATAQLVLPVGVATSLVGSTVHFAAVSLNMSGRPVVSSWPVAVEVIP